MKVDATIGRIVRYRSKVGGYELPAVITATVETLHDPGVARYIETGGREGVPPLSSPEHVHLTVFSPGLPGNPDPPVPLDANRGGSYREWDVPFAADGAAGAWSWPRHFTDAELKAGAR